MQSTLVVGILRAICVYVILNVCLQFNENQLDSMGEQCFERDTAVHLDEKTFVASHSSLSLVTKPLHVILSFSMVHTSGALYVETQVDTLILYISV